MKRLFCVALLILFLLVSCEKKAPLAVLTIDSNRTENGYEKADLSLRMLSLGGDGSIEESTATAREFPVNDNALDLPVWCYFTHYDENGTLIVPQEERTARMESGKAYVGALLGEEALQKLTLQADEHSPYLFSAEGDGFSIGCGIGALTLRLPAVAALPQGTEEKDLLHEVLGHEMLKKAMGLLDIKAPALFIQEHQKDEAGAVKKLSYAIYDQSKGAENELFYRAVPPLTVTVNPEGELPYLVTMVHKDTYLPLATADTVLTAEDAVQNVLNDNLFEKSDSTAELKQEMVRTIGVTYLAEVQTGPNEQQENRHLFYIPYYVVEEKTDLKTEKHLIPYANFSHDALNAAADSLLQPATAEKTA